MLSTVQNQILNQILTPYTMEKSTKLSMAATLAIVVVIASCAPFSSATRAQVVVESEPAPVDKVTFCHTNADCKNTRCYPEGRLAFCDNGVCTCEVAAKDTSAVIKDEACSTIKDCTSTKCIPQPGWHLICADGECKCVFDVPPRN